MSLYDLFPPEFFKLSVPLSAYLILSAILFQMSMGTTAYGSMSVTGVVLGSASKYSHFRSAFLSMGI